ncbi:MAG: TolC family protein [Pseudomonadota bacterium]
MFSLVFTVGGRTPAAVCGPLAGLLLAAAVPVATAASDPWQVGRDLPATPAGGWVQACEYRPDAALDLAALVRLALCRNPDTRVSWRQMLAQAERVGAAKADRLPSVTLSAGYSSPFGDRERDEGDSTSAGASLDWLLYDFGARPASIRSSELTLSALRHSHDDSVQAVFAAAVDAYYQWFAADAALTAAREAETAAGETLRAADSRMRAGAATREDFLQAQTAQAQARLTTIQSEGDRESALGAVAVILALPASTPVTLLAPADAPAVDAAGTPPDWPALLARSQAQRPDLLAQSLRIDSARADHEAAAAAGRPSISFSARDSVDLDNNSESGEVGIDASWPLFTGFRTGYRTRAAAQQVEIEKANYEKLLQSASLELWQAWQSMRTAGATVTAADALVDSAQESLRAARARYGAGLGDLINVLNAQSTLADARRQQLRARYDWYRARIALARASGELGWSDLAPSGATDAGTAAGDIKP